MTTTTTAAPTETAAPAEGDAVTAPPVDAPTDETTEPAETSDGEPEGRSKASREAAKYRTQLRAVEAERDTLTGRVEALQRAQVEGMAQALAVPGDLWAVGGVDLPALLDAEGNVDAAAVREAVAAVVKTRPGLSAPRGARPDPSQGGTGNASAGSGGASWSGVISRGRK